MLLSAFAVANAEPSATALEPQDLISKINRDVAIRFVHSQDESAGSKPAARPQCTSRVCTWQTRW